MISTDTLQHHEIHGPTQNFALVAREGDPRVHVVVFSWQEDLGRMSDFGDAGREVASQVVCRYPKNLRFYAQSAIFRINLSLWAGPPRPIPAPLLAARVGVYNDCKRGL